MEAKWYVIQTYSGYEEKVKVSLEDRIQSASLDSYVEEILIPSEEVVDTKPTKKRLSSKYFFPGYILVKMQMNEMTWKLIKGTPRVAGFVGGSRNPPSIPDEEVERITKRINDGSLKIRPNTYFDRGDNIRVTDGPFINFNGVVDEVNNDKNKLKVFLSIFGRPTPVELEFNQVEKC